MLPKHWVRSNQVERFLEFVQVIVGSLFIGLLAQVHIPLPFTPVPLSLQTLAVLLLASSLGSKKATLAVLVYLAEIGFGLPILAGAISKPLALIGTNAGYLFGFIPLAFCAGWILERKNQFSEGLTCVAIMMISFLQLLIGALWLGIFVGQQNILMMGFIPFIPGEMLKVLVTVAFQKKFRRAFE